MTGYFYFLFLAYLIPPREVGTGTPEALGGIKEMMEGRTGSGRGPPSTLVLPKTFIPSSPHPRPLPFLSAFLPRGAGCWGGGRSQGSRGWKKGGRFGLDSKSLTACLFCLPNSLSVCPLSIPFPNFPFATSPYVCLPVMSVSCIPGPPRC